MADIAGAALGGLLGPKPPKPQKKYFAKESQTALYGMMLPALAAWGSSVPEAMLRSSPKMGESFLKMFGEPITGGERPQQIYPYTGLPLAPGQTAMPQPGGYGRIPPQGPGPGQTMYMSGQSGGPDMTQDAALQKTLQFLQTPKTRFGYGGGNLGSYTGGFGGQLSGVPRM